MLWVLEIFVTFAVRGATLDVRISTDRRQILTSKVDPRAERVNNN